MIILKYTKTFHKNIINACVKALKQGKIVAYPTDTSYGLAVDATNIKAIQKLYKIKGRAFNKPVHIVIPSVSYGKKIVKWDNNAEKLAKKFWQGAITLVLRLRAKGIAYRKLSANSGFIGLRMPDNKIALDLAKYLKQPITATSANFSGAPDCYSAEEIVKQFRNKKNKPDIILDAGKLEKRKPSTLVKIDGEQISILRIGLISEKVIRDVVGRK